MKSNLETFFSSPEWHKHLKSVRNRPLNCNDSHFLHAFLNARIKNITVDKKMCWLESFRITRHQLDKQNRLRASWVCHLWHLCFYDDTIVLFTFRRLFLPCSCFSKSLIVPFVHKMRNDLFHLWKSKLWVTQRAKAASSLFGSQMNWT